MEGSLIVMSQPSHVDLLRTITALVRDAGPAAALDALRRDEPTIPVPGDRLDATPGYHDTLAVFHVWAVDRLLSAGLSDLAVLWHPLTHQDSPLMWWDVATLASTEARQGFVASTIAASFEPMPSEPRVLLAA
jgi:hypothetical protein